MLAQVSVGTQTHLCGHKGKCIEMKQRLIVYEAGSGQLPSDQYVLYSALDRASKPDERQC